MMIDAKMLPSIRWCLMLFTDAFDEHRLIADDLGVNVFGQQRRKSPSAAA